MSKIGNYVIWCEEMGYTNDMGEVDSMDHVDEYMNYQGMKILEWEEDANEMSSMQQTTK